MVLDGLFYFYLIVVLRRFQHSTGHIMTGSWKGRGDQYIQFVRVLYCKLPTNGKQLPAFPLEAMPGTEPQPQIWEARVLPLCHRGPLVLDEAAIVQMLNPAACKNFSEYAYEIFFPYMSLVIITPGLGMGQLSC